MELIKNKKYRVIVNLPFYGEEEFCLYFRKIILDEQGFPVFNFSESLDDSSKFYNFRSSDFTFRIFSCEVCCNV